MNPEQKIASLEVLLKPGSGATDNEKAIARKIIADLRKKYKIETKKPTPAPKPAEPWRPKKASPVPETPQEPQERPKARPRPKPQAKPKKRKISFADAMRKVMGKTKEDSRRMLPGRKPNFSEILRRIIDEEYGGSLPVERKPTDSIWFR